MTFMTVLNINKVQKILCVFRQFGHQQIKQPLSLRSKHNKQIQTGKITIGKLLPEDKRQFSKKKCLFLEISMHVFMGKRIKLIVATLSVAENCVNNQTAH